MIRAGFILIPVAWIFTICVYSQSDTAQAEIQIDVLQAEDLVFTTDSGRLNVISAGRISKNLDELPLTTYIISHEEILRNQFTSLIGRKFPDLGLNGEPVY